MSNRTHHHWRRHWAQHDSPLCAAFLAALAKWILKHKHDSTAQVMLPTGRVGVEELTAVLRALEIARQAGAR
jgi:hypothetical protein